MWLTIQFNPKFAKNIYFIHLNQKQQSNKEVNKYSELKKDIAINKITNEITLLTNSIIQAENLTTFEEILLEHEQLLSHVLQRETSKNDLFQLYKGGITKYLGAWGGDFILVTAKSETELSYFKNNGFNTIVSFEKMILQNK